MSKTTGTKATQTKPIQTPVQAFLSALGHVEAGGVTEVCIFDGKKVSSVGYFNDPTKAAQAIEKCDGNGNIFVTLNSANPALLARYNNKLVKGTYQKPVERTQDQDIHRDSWFPIDFDPKRPSGISSTDDEKREAHGVARAVLNWLLSIGVPESAIMTCDSGNGAYVLIRTLDCEVTKEHAERKQAFLNFIADKFNTDKVEIDRKVYNAGRLIGALGTLKMKGEDIPERPHRRSAVFTIAGELFDRTKDQRCEPFDLYALAEKIIPALNINAPGANPASKTGAQSNKGNGKVWFDARLIADKLSNPKQTTNGFTKYDCPNCGHAGKFWIKDADGKSGCYEPESVCDWRKLRDKIREIAKKAGIEIDTHNGSSRQPQGVLSIEEVCIADVEMKPIDWLWEGRIARACVTLLEGIEGEGKSTVLCAIATAISRGASGLKDMLLDGPGNVLWLSAEDNVASVLKPRLLAAGADESKIFAVGEAFTFDDQGVELVRGMIKRRNPIMVVIDPVFAYTKGDPSKVSDVRPITSKLKQLAEEFNCAIILVRHVGKSKGLGDPRAAGLYSIEWRAAARSVLLCGSDPDNPQTKALTQTKSNNGELSPSIGYVIEKDPTSPSRARFRWVGESNLTANRILQIADNENKQLEKVDAEDFLREALESGEQKFDDIVAEGKRFSISISTLKRAKSRLGIKSRRVGFGEGSVVFWCFPEETLEAKDETLEENLVIGDIEPDPSIGCQPEQNDTLWIDDSKDSTYSDKTPIECHVTLYAGDDPLHTVSRDTLWEKDADKSNKENGLLIGCQIGQVDTLCKDPIRGRNRKTKRVDNETLETLGGL